MGFLSLPFIARFAHMRCHIQGQGFGNKMYISELFTVVGYLHTACFKNSRGITFAKCILPYCEIALDTQKTVKKTNMENDIMIQRENVDNDVVKESNQLECVSAQKSLNKDNFNKGEE